MTDGGGCRGRESSVSWADPALEAFLEGAFQNLGDGFFLCTSDGLVASLNPAAAALFERPAAELVGRRFSTLFGASAGQGLDELQRCALGGGSRAFELHSPAGGRWELKASPVPGDGGLVAGFSVMARDISRRWEAEQALTESQLELKMRSASLEVEAAERRRLAEAYGQLLDNSLQGILIFQDNQVVFANQTAARITGYSRRALLRLSPDTIRLAIHSADRAATWERLQRRVAGEEVPARSQLRIHRKDGSLCWLEMHASRIEFQGRSAVQAVVVDITERLHHERQQEAVLTVAKALRQAPTRGEMLPVILDQLSDLLEAEGALFAICEREDDEALLELACGAWADATGDTLPLEDSLTGWILNTGESYCSGDARDDVRFARPDLLQGTHAVIGMPLIAKDVPIGVLWVGRAAEFLPEDLRVLSAIAEMTALAIHRATLFERTQKRVLHLDALHRIDRAIASSLDLELIFNVLLDQVMDHLEVDAARVLHRRQDRPLLVPMAARGFRSTPAVVAPVAFGEGLAGQVARARRSLVVRDLRDRSEPGSGDPLLLSENFVAYVGVPLVVKEEVKGVLEVYNRQPLRTDAEGSGFLQTLAGQAAVAIDNAAMFEALQSSHEELARAYDTTLEGWSRALELRDRETEGHTRRVSDMAVRLAGALGVAPEELVQVRRGALLHDIGKIAIPDSILLKEGPLDEAEWQVMRRHPTYARQMLDRIDFLRPAIPIPWCHHERWDGSGYPRGLAAEQIPLVARAFAVVDVWDALLSDRPYRQAWTPERARRHITANAGSHFDPEIVAAFLDLL